MNIQIFGKKKCFDTGKAQRWFKERGIKFQYIDLNRDGISPGELNNVARTVGGMRNMLDPDAKGDAADLVRYLSGDITNYLLDEPTLLKTPIVRNGKQVTLGYQPDIWKNWE